MDAIEDKAIADATDRMRKQETKALTQALERNDTNKFGFCADCGDNIEQGRLTVNPALMECRDFANG